jgi:hypothetical protein
VKPVHPPWHVLLAALLGGPLAGCLVLRRNYTAFGRPGAARKAWIWGLVATLAMIPIIYFIPESFPHMAIPAAYTMALYYFAKTDQRPAYEQSLQHGGARASVWITIGIGVACMAAITGMVFTFNYLRLN